MSLVATMPGRMGDLLLAMPVVRELCTRTRSKAPAVIVTSAYCAPVVPLLRTLPYVREVVVVPEGVYRIEHTHFGAQPWEMPVPAAQPSEWAADLVPSGPAHPPVYHLGFRHFPYLGQSVPDLAGEPYGVTPPPGPWLPLVRVDPDGPVAMSAAAPTWMFPHVPPHKDIVVFGTLAELQRWPTLPPKTIALPVDDYLDIHRVLDGCSAFWGNNSGPSIVAMGAGLPVVWAHDGKEEPERWAHHGCDVSEIAQDGAMRRLRG